MKNKSIQLNIRIEHFLRKHPLLNVKALEREAHVPVGTIWLALNYNRLIPVKYEKQIVKILENYGMKIVTLGDRQYEEGDIVHFQVPGINDHLFEGTLIWSNTLYSFILKPTGRTDWHIDYETLHPEWQYYE